MFCAVLFIVASLMRLSMQTLKQPEWTESSCENNVYNDYNSLFSIVTITAYEAFQALCINKP